MFWVRLALPHFSCISFFSGNQVIMDKSWIFSRKCRRKRGYTKEMCLDWVFHPRFRRHFRQKIQDLSMMTWFPEKTWYTWKMRKSEPDSKYFGKIRGNLRLPCQNLQKPQKKCANYLLCGFLRNWRMSRYFQNLLEFPLTFGFYLKIDNLSTFFDDFFCKVL